MANATSILRRMFGGPFPRTWRGLFISCFVIGCLWLISLSSFLVLQRWTLELTALLGFVITAIVVSWARWFPSRQALVLALQQIISALTIVGFVMGGVGLLILASIRSSNRVVRSWDLPHDTHVEVLAGHDMFGNSRLLRARHRSDFTSQAWVIAPCRAASCSAPVTRVDDDCVVSVRVGRGDSVPDSVDPTSIRFSPECHAVERK